MKQFTFSKSTDSSAAVKDAAESNTAQQGATIRYVAGGTTLLDLMKLNVEGPDKLIDINKLPLDKIETAAGQVKIGAMVRNSDLANHPFIKGEYAVLSQALLSGASAQLRNMATTGGNLLQRTRCMYFRDTDFACNKREPGSGCPAITGDNRTLAILGCSDSCIATNPSDMNVALMALDATIHIKGVSGDRQVAIGDFFVLPGNTPHIENVMQPGDLITHVILKSLPAGSTSAYLKLRDRASYEFALASVAVVGNALSGKFSSISIALGGVGTKPWRAVEAEKFLTGKAANEENFRKAAAIALQDAKPQSQNKFKIELSRRCIVHALKTTFRGE
ncbi:MAG: xanthine dehydrogenase family protein subunit M [Candidatus Obscuribacterales bacterium]|jgi:xanthine dehydrogenase YagS FAD-binding subunit